MKQIILTKGKFTIVDDEDFEYLNQWKWQYGKNGYVSRRSWSELSLNKKRKGKNISLHRLLINAPEGFDVDHINGNTLDNRKENLRIITHQKNAFNSKVERNSLSGRKGVNWKKDCSRWRSHITIDGKTIYLGCFVKLEDAISARIKAEKIYHKI